VEDGAEEGFWTGLRGKTRQAELAWSWKR